MFLKKHLLTLLLALLLLVYLVINCYLPEPYRFETLFYAVAAVLMGAMIINHLRK